MLGEDEGAAVLGDEGYVVIGNNAWRVYGRQNKLIREEKGGYDNTIAHVEDFFLACKLERNLPPIWKQSATRRVYCAIWVMQLGEQVVR